MTNDIVKIPFGEFHVLGLELPDGLNEIEWKRVGHGLMRAKKGLQFAIGDWLNYGEAAYGDKYNDALEIFGIEANGEYGYEEQSLRIFAHVAARVKKFTRVNNLDWRHHFVVAKLEEEDQAHWLGEAQKNKWSSRKLMAMLRAHLAVATDKPDSVFAGLFTFEAWFSEFDRNFESLVERMPLEKWAERDLRKRIEKIEEIKKPLVEEAQRRGLEVAA
jgi:hypothetical protein